MMTAKIALLFQIRKLRGYYFCGSVSLNKPYIFSGRMQQRSEMCCFGVVYVLFRRRICAILRPEIAGFEIVFLTD